MQAAAGGETTRRARWHLALESLSIGAAGKAEVDSLQWVDRTEHAFASVVGPVLLQGKVAAIATATVGSFAELIAELVVAGIVPSLAVIVRVLLVVAARELAHLRLVVTAIRFGGLEWAKLKVQVATLYWFLTLLGSNST